MRRDVALDRHVIPAQCPHHTETPAVTMLLHSERACGSSARRRRERRLRSWAKHERMSIAIVVAENLHHSRQKVEGNTSKGLRAQKSAAAPGCHPGILKDPEVQWLKERSLFRVSFAGCFAVDRTRASSGSVSCSLCAGVEQCGEHGLYFF